MEDKYFAAIAATDTGELKDLLQAAPEVVRARLPAVGDGPLCAEGGTGLHVCVQIGHVELARMLLDAGIEVDARSHEGRTALHDAIEHGQHGIQELLLKRGAEVDICAAAILGRLDRVREILDTDPAQANDMSTHLSPLGWASFGNQVDTARELMTRGARMDDGELLCAASVGHVQVGQVLIKGGADPDKIHAPAGCAAIHAAAAMRYSQDGTAFISMLLASGAHPGLRTAAGQTALEIAEAGLKRQEEGAGEAGDQECRKNFEGVIAFLRGSSS